MNEIQKQNSEIAILDGLAREAQYYAGAAMNDMLQLGRVLTEAKKLVPHGQWSKWLAENASCSERTAQNFMAAYARFGQNAAVARLDRSKVFQMLSLPEGTEDAFLRENDVAAMSAREVGRAVKAARAEVAPVPGGTEDAGQTAEARPSEAGRREMEKQKELIGLQNREIDRLTRQVQQMETDAADREQTISMLETRLAGANEQLASSQSRAAREEIDTGVGGMTAQAFGEAVQRFVGSCAQLPHMRRAFARMSGEEHEQYVASLETMEAFCTAVRDAVDSVEVQAE